MDEIACYSLFTCFFLFFNPKLLKVSSAEPVQLAALYQIGGDTEQILITKTTSDCCSYKHVHLRTSAGCFMFWIFWNVSEETFVFKFGPDRMRTPDKECECVTCAFETLAVLAVEEERLLSL